MLKLYRTWLRLLLRGRAGTQRSQLISAVAALVSMAELIFKIVSIIGLTGSTCARGHNNRRAVPFR